MVAIAYPPESDPIAGPAVTAETIARAAADSAEVTARTIAIAAAISGEATTRAAADTALDGRLTTVESGSATAAQKTANLSDLASAATARANLQVPALAGAVAAVTTSLADIAAPVGLGVAAVASGGSFAARTYYWQITFVNANGETTGSNEVSAAIILNGSANLTWPAAPAGVTAVKVYRTPFSGWAAFDNPPNPAPLITTLAANATAYTDTGTAGTTGHVPAVNGTGFTTAGIPASSATDGVTVVSGDTILLTAQTQGAKNGPWVIAAGAWARPADFASGSVGRARQIAVQNGTSYGGTVWKLKATTAITVDTTVQNWYLGVRTDGTVARLPDAKNNLIAGRNAMPTPGVNSANNVALGFHCLEAAGNVVSNVAIGMQCMGTTQGDYNVAIGFSVLGGADAINGGADLPFPPAVQNRNVGIGHEVMIIGTTCAYNVGIGESAMVSLSTGQSNVSIGNSPMTALKTGSNNVAIGTSAGRNNIAGSKQVAIGYQALYACTGDSNVAIGGSAGQALVASNNNVFVGEQAGTAQTSGATPNVAVGYQAMRSNQTGVNNVAVGYRSMDGTTGSNNTAIGEYALGGVTTGSLNVGCGQNTLRNMPTGSNSVAVGARAGWTDGVAASTDNSLVTLLGYNAQATVGRVVVLGSAVAAERASVAIGCQGSAANLGNGVGAMVALNNVSTAPSANHPSGGQLYAEGGALKWRSSGGTVTTIAPV